MFGEGASGVTPNFSGTFTKTEGEFVILGFRVVLASESSTLWCDR